MDWKSVIDAVVGALIGGMAVATFALLKYGTLRTEVIGVREEVNGMKKSLEKCQDQRLVCQDAIKRHHENSTAHVTESLTEIISDMRDRVMRIENKLFNGKS